MVKEDHGLQPPLLARPSRGVPAAPGHLSRTWCCSQVTPDQALSHLQLGQSHTSGARATHLARPRSASAPPCPRHRFIACKSRVWRFPVSPTPGPRAGVQSAPKGKGEFSAPLPGSRGRFPTGGGRGRFPTCPSRRPSPRGTRARARGSDPSCPNRCPRRAAPACAAAGPAWLLTPPSVPVPAPAANPVTGLAAGQEGTR